MCHDFNWESEEKVMLRFGEISMTSFQVEQSFQGGEGACHHIIIFMECLKKDMTDGNRIFVPPLVKVKKHCFASKFKNYCKYQHHSSLDLSPSKIHLETSLK